MIIVIDDFIKDESLLTRIKEDPNFFSETGVYHWYSGWFRNEPANTLKKELIEYIWADNCPISKSYDIAGFEYWTGIQSADASLGFKDNLGVHYDKDESLFKLNGDIKTPVIGTVYYPQQDEFEGGMLEIYTNGRDAEPEKIYAKPNRLIIFDAGEVLHRVTKVTKGTRKAIAINLWTEEPYSKTIGDLKEV